MSNKNGIIALSPLIVLILVYLSTSIIAHDFYAIPITITFLIASIYSICISTKYPIKRRIEIFNRGAGNSNLLLMVWIFILAGAFANSAKAMGCIDSTVNLTLSLLPDNLLYAGLFLASCIISLSIGTSVGTIVALVPIAMGIGNTINQNIPMLIAIVIGGSFFGDNLSFISDTTIVSTSTQGCKLSDKFRVNSYIVFPVATIVFLLYLIIGNNANYSHPQSDINVVNIIPYIAVLVTAILGMNVMAVLTLGIILTGVIGVSEGAYDFFQWLKTLGDGIVSMGELIIVTILAGGLLEMIKENGGIDYIIKKIMGHVHSKSGAEFSISVLVSLVNVCTANNTVAIITVGDIAKKISDRYGIDNRKSASLLDTFSCVVQGILPYGAQILMASGLSKVNPIHFIGYLYYPFLLGIFALLSIYFRYPKKFS